MASDIKLEVAVPCPLRNTFTYKAPAELAIEPGMWVEVPFGKRRVTGLVMALAEGAASTDYEIKSVFRLADLPYLGQDLLKLLGWAQRYYHTPPWEVVSAAVPTRLLSRQPHREQRWSLAVEANLEHLARAPRQLALATWLIDHPDSTDAQIEQAGFSPALRRELHKRTLLTMADIDTGTDFPVGNPSLQIRLDPDQSRAANSIDLNRFQTYLLQGPTGSGKTEVYLEVAQRAIDAGQQVLILVPEIGLTPQTEARFRNSLRARIGSYHSGLTDSDRRLVWQACYSGDLDLVIGTRSAIFLPMQNPGLVVIDEEHDNSYKQQDGWRYHARQLAAIRARLADRPLLMGSATPSLESLLNVERSRYQMLELHRRHGNRPMPTWQILQPRGYTQDLLDEQLLQQMDLRLQRGEQVLVFLNRRGYAPSYQCQSCRWVANCPDCSCHLTAHLKNNTLLCHQCGFSRPLPSHCDRCQSLDLEMLGMGTERLETFLTRRYPHLPLLRLDRDNVRQRGRLESLLREAGRGEPAILIGTQMLAKGHHFPAVTLSIILGVDQGLMSADPCALEQTAQLCVQVAGRSGRGDRSGCAMLVTELPQHPAIELLTRDGYKAFAKAQLQLRSQTGLPPVSHWSLVRAEHAKVQTCEQALQQAVDTLRRAGLEQVQWLGPIPCLLERRGNRYRYQLQLQSRQRSSLHQAVDIVIEALTRLPSQTRPRWSIDMDPVSMD